MNDENVDEDGDGQSVCQGDCNDSDPELYSYDKVHICVIRCHDRCLSINLGLLLSCTSRTATAFLRARVIATTPTALSSLEPPNGGLLFVFLTLQR